MGELQLGKSRYQMTRFGPISHWTTLKAEASRWTTRLLQQTFQRFAVERSRLARARRAPAPPAPERPSTVVRFRIRPSWRFFAIRPPGRRPGGAAMARPLRATPAARTRRRPCKPASRSPPGSRRMPARLAAGDGERPRPGSDEQRVQRRYSSASISGTPLSL